MRGATCARVAGEGARHTRSRAAPQRPRAFTTPLLSFSLPLPRSSLTSAPSPPTGLPFRTFDRQPDDDRRIAGGCSAYPSRERVFLGPIEVFKMVSEFTASVGNEDALMAEKPVERSPPSKRIQGKVPKKVHKAEREKLKREHLNELFQELGHALEPARQNNGKASILSDTTRLLHDMLAQVESLRKENAALVTESRYVTVEKNELRDENLALETEIQKLQNELRGKMQSNPAWRNGMEAAAPAVPQPSTTALPMQQPPPVVGPVYVIPLNQELPTYPQETMLNPASPPKPSSHVTRPHARYPTPSDSWPLQILSQQHRTAAQDGHHSGSSSSNNTANSTPTSHSEGFAKE